MTSSTAMAIELAARADERAECAEIAEAYAAEAHSDGDETAERTADNISRAIRARCPA